MSVNFFEQAAEAIIKGDSDKAIEVAKSSLDNGIDPLEMIEKGFTLGLEIVGEKFDKAELFLPELIQCAMAMKSATGFLQEAMGKSDQSKEIKIVLGTVEGDVHDIGKGIVASLFVAHGIEVFDLGSDVSTERFIDKALEVDADIIGTSALLTTTMLKNKELLEILEEKGLRDKIKVIIGGGPVTKRFADRIGADAYAENAHEGVKKVLDLTKK